MWPSPGEHLLRFVGDRLHVTLAATPDLDPSVRAYLRTNLTRAAVARAEVVAQAGLRGEDALTFAGASWRDIPLLPDAQGWSLDLPLLEVGHFRAKAYFVEASGRQVWPEGGDVGISVHPDHLRTGNIIYCVFPRTIRSEAQPPARGVEAAIQSLDERGFTVIPPSGTLRALTRELPHVFDRLGCRVLHLLPIGPVPTTYARMGRFGSPYAQLDLTGIDPALVEFDKRSTGVDQFRELADGVHLRDGLVLLDVVLNHTGWSSRLMEEHPEYFMRTPEGSFHSPGAWGTVWADLVELDQKRSLLWDVLAEALLVWCRRGVDGFRCDAGYMIPLPAWQYIVARVRQQFPNTVFLLEGLGGAWEATENLLMAGGMQWAYSELFQCFAPRHVAEYLDHASHQSTRIGVLAHYSETHDNDRLAKRGARWALMRNQLCALASHNGAFGFSAGVEWLSITKFDVHEAHPLSWGASPNLVSELARLARLLSEHPCFFDGARVERVSALESPVLGLARTSADGKDQCLVLINLDVDAAQEITLPHEVWARGGEKHVDLLGAPAPAAEHLHPEQVRISLAAGQAFCLAHAAVQSGLSGDAYRERRAQAAWAYAQLAHVLPHESLGAADFVALADLVSSDPAGFLARLARLDAERARADLLDALRASEREPRYPCVVLLRPEDARRITLLPPGHFLLIEDEAPFEARIGLPSGDRHLRSTRMRDAHVVALPPQPDDRGELDVAIHLERFGRPGTGVALNVRRLAEPPRVARGGADDLVLLTNGRGAMARLYADLGRVRSKYDCLLGANLHSEFPVDRHIMIKRVRAWVNADGFITPLDEGNLLSIEPGPPALWTFAANAGEGRRVGIRLDVELRDQQNTVVLRLTRCAGQPLDLGRERRVAITLRLDLEDRSFHAETHHDPGLAGHFEESVLVLPEGRGFVFAPDASRALHVSADRGEYHAGVEWLRDIAHDLEGERGLGARGDAFSPGWLELPLTEDEAVTVVCTLEPESVAAPASTKAPRSDDFEAALRRAASHFVVKRGAGRTVIAGYPWFLDWGRDTFVAARGLIAAGYHDDVREMLLTYAALERDGTLPNYLTGAGEGSRETSDAPLWFALACEELAEQLGTALYDVRAADRRSLREVLLSIATGLVRGAENGVRVDLASGLVFSPPHFTWMDTNYPACTPREGYPIEIAALFIRLLSQLQRLDVREIDGHPVHELALRALDSLELFWRPELGFFSDTLHAGPGTPASAARPDDHLRPNQLLAVSLGLVSAERARSAVAAAGRHLLVPGAMRTLAPLLVHYALPVRDKDGALLGDPAQPYRGRYEGDEDTQRKPAYHNGTAWPWWLATYCEALTCAYPGDERAQAAARAILGSAARLLGSGCLGQLPEILDGDAPHRERGCDAQAWSVTETLRGWLVLKA
jgi:starch synthase (maltosyl-transferring)